MITSFIIHYLVWHAHDAFWGRRADRAGFSASEAAASINTCRLIRSNLPEARFWTVFGLPAQLMTDALPTSRAARPMPPPDRSIHTRAIGTSGLGSDTLHANGISP